jgi:hypothetical protein
LSCAYARATSRCIAIYNRFNFSIEAKAKFHQVLKEAYPALREWQDVAVWPSPPEKWNLVYIGRNIYWSPLWEKWYIRPSADYVEAVLWREYIVQTSSFPIYWGSRHARQRELHLSSSSGARLVRFYWCQQCQRWEEDSLQHLFSLEQDKLPLEKSTYEVVCKLLDGEMGERATEILRTDHILVWLLYRWSQLSQEQKDLLEKHFSYGTQENILEIAKMVVGLEVILLESGARIERIKLQQSYWNTFNWISTQIDQEAWGTALSKAFGVWVYRRWLQKKSKGVYIRLIPTSSNNNAPEAKDQEEGSLD